MTNVMNLNGGNPHVHREVNDAVVGELERLLEMAKSGEINGIACAAQHHDNLGSYSVVGMVGGYSHLGAATLLLAELTDAVREINS